MAPLLEACRDVPAAYGLLKNAHGNKQQSKLSKKAFSAGVIGFNWCITRQLHQLRHHNVFLSGEKALATCCCLQHHGSPSGVTSTQQHHKALVFCAVFTAPPSDDFNSDLVQTTTSSPGSEQEGPLSFSSIPTSMFTAPVPRTPLLLPRAVIQSRYCCPWATCRRLG